MAQVKTKPFQVTRVPGLNGEWIDLHMTQTGNVSMDTSGYVEVSYDSLLTALKSLRSG